MSHTQKHHYREWGNTSVYVCVLRPQCREYSWNITVFFMLGAPHSVEAQKAAKLKLVGLVRKGALVLMWSSNKDTLI